MATNRLPPKDSTEKPRSTPEELNALAELWVRAAGTEPVPLRDDLDAAAEIAEGRTLEEDLELQHMIEHLELLNLADAVRRAPKIELQNVDIVAKGRAEQSKQSPGEWLATHIKSTGRLVRRRDRALIQKCMAETGASWREVEKAIVDLPEDDKAGRGRPRKKT
jgi:hypothetical protein